MLRREKIVTDKTGETTDIMAFIRLDSFSRYPFVISLTAFRAGRISTHTHALMLANHSFVSLLLRKLFNEAGNASFSSAVVSRGGQGL
jgi:hypothetical protein